MRSRRAGILAVVAALLAGGCGRSPKAVFSDLREAAAGRDAAVIWANVTDSTRADLEERAKAISVPGGAAEAGRAYLETLAYGLDDFAIEYIKTLRPGEISISGNTALMTVVSPRFGRVDKTIVFRKVDGVWRWDARDMLTWYLDNRSSFHDMGV